MRHDFLLRLSSLVILFAAGCGASVGDVRGVVTFQGKPLTHGNVRIMPATGLSVDSSIAPDGKYLVKDVPIGVGKVIVTCMDESMTSTLKSLQGKKVDPQQKGRTPTPISTTGIVPGASFSLIPSIYSDFENSGLAVDVKGGTTTYDISLTGEAPKLFKIK